jgi:hypothetical protein
MSCGALLQAEASKKYLEDFAQKQYVLKNISIL